ncbi:MAG: transketolase C-terminal domain-containing protein [bacterium]|nr:transketolase C-terminal domain-containing protein [bacterium]
MEKKATRHGYSEALIEMGATNKNIVVLDADLSRSTSSELFKKKFPERFFNVGVAEQNLLGLAAGLSLMGKIPFASTYSVFASGRAWEQLRTTICYSNLNVKIGGSHGGILTGPDGASHQALEEFALTRVLPNLTVFVPCDFLEAKKATIAAAELKGPVYIRLGREPLPVLTTQETPFIPGEGLLMKEGRDVTIIACGSLVAEALQAAALLEKEKISARVINIHSLKPLDENIIIKAARETKAIVTAEEHEIYGGLGSAVSEVVVKNYPVPLEMVGLADSFGTSGAPEELMRFFHLKDVDIVAAVKKVITRKG